MFQACIASLHVLTLKSREHKDIFQIDKSKHTLQLQDELTPSQRSNITQSDYSRIVFTVLVCKILKSAVCCYDLLLPCVVLFSLW